MENNEVRKTCVMLYAIKVTEYTKYTDQILLTCRLCRLNCFWDLIYLILWDRSSGLLNFSTIKRVYFLVLLSLFSECYEQEEEEEPRYSWGVDLVTSQEPAPLRTAQGGPRARPPRRGSPRRQSNMALKWVAVTGLHSKATAATAVVFVWESATLALQH